jgi:hypothetical protein
MAVLMECTEMNMEFLICLNVIEFGLYRLPVNTCQTF